MKDEYTEYTDVQMACKFVNKKLFNNTIYAFFLKWLISQTFTICCALCNIILPVYYIN